MLGNVYGRVIYAPLLTYIDKLSLFDENQIRQAMDDKQSACCIFHDLKKAFDLLDILPSKLESFGFRDRVLTLLISYLNNRKQFLHIDTYRSSCQSVKCGVPQGSVLAPSLCLLYFNDLPRHVKACITFLQMIRISFTMRAPVYDRWLIYLTMLMIC